MCVIIAKPWAVKSPSLETFKTAMRNNPHGFSIAYKTANKPWKVYRSMSESLMLQHIQKNGLLKPQSKWIFHARIKTHGEATIENTHCWRDSRTDTIFAHNGTLGITADDGKTDSETFFRKVFVPIYKHEGRKAALDACEMIIHGYSKFAIVMEKELNDIVLVGQWIKKNGVSYSNETAFHDRYQQAFVWNEEYENEYWAEKQKQFGQKHSNNLKCNTNINIQSPSQETRSSTVNFKHHSAGQLASQFGVNL